MGSVEFLEVGNAGICFFIPALLYFIFPSFSPVLFSAISKKKKER